MRRSIQLTVPNACHENWHTMTPSDQGRFCMSCKKNVIDFTNMSDVEIIRHIQQASAGVCGRLHVHQLERPVLIRKESRLPWLKYFFRLTLPAILVSLKSQGQNNKQADTVQAQRAPKINITALQQDISGKNALVVEGKVTDEYNNPLAGASVMVKGTSKGTHTDAQGNFSMTFTEAKEVTLQISYVGFMLLEVKSVPVKVPGPQTLQLKMSPAVSGELVIAGSIELLQVKPKRSLREKVRSILITDSLRLFPNPVGAGSQVNVELNVKKSGNYYIGLIDYNGKLIDSRFVYAGEKAFATTLDTQQLLPGNYIVTVWKKNGKKIAVKKIMVQ